MDVVKLIGEVRGADRDALYEKAVFLDNMCADELLYIDKGSLENKEEVDVKAIKTIAKASSLPINVIAGIHRFEDIKKLIYAGAKRVILPTEGWDNQDAVKEASGRFGVDRIYLLMKPDQETNDHEQCLLRARVALEEEGFGGIFLMGDVRDMCYVRTADFLKYKVNEPVMIQSSAATEEELLTNVKMTLASAIALMDGSLTDLMAAKLYLKKNGIETETFESKISFEEFKLNADGMIPVITQDYKTDEVLMLAYMTKESFEKTIETGKMCYYSRSRQELWTKGDTSGHYQYVKSLTLDCDNDTILARVAQVGAACHTGNRTCFFQPLVDRENKTASALSVLEDVSETIADRKEHPKEGSYTNYLFDKGIDKILKKVGEEAAEIIIAAKNPDSDELKYEICDFLYHMMVLMEERNVDWKQITEELATRH